ncbi:RNA polymerase sigma factor [Sphaerotilus mobilis]|uniref:RNA polymerase sigma factor n=1 Tax=Sphaerotilus mobilis TaxID=47994 RepID=A0A4Q7LVP8_9BURK|nr:sigma-70 family RNA polymerase sigma factor [Sphaerotilus mobilis]RZS58603.1 RNA polymerase ECF family sigma subunit [Sphaerotilus mobilis]
MPQTSTDPTARAEELAALLSRVALRDRRAFQDLYERSSPHLFAVVLRIQRNRALAEDVLQEVYVNIWRSASSYDTHRSQAMTWLTSVARNRAIDSLRRRQTEPDTVSSQTWHGDGDPDNDDMLERMPSDMPGPEQLLVQAAQAQSIQGCMGQLSAEQQQSLALAFYQGLSHAEVADHLSQPLGTVKSWLRRGLQALKGCLDKLGVRSGATVEG